jgi:hypothetical protein
LPKGILAAFAVFAAPFFLMPHSTALRAIPRRAASALGYDGFIECYPEATTMTQPYTTERAENRVDMKIAALLIGRHGRLGVERAITENVSSRGIRVISSSEWYVDDTILVSLPAGHYTSAARVAYCDTSGKGRYIAGLEFVGSNGQLQIAAIDTTGDY